jgi:integrase
MLVCKTPEGWRRYPAAFGKNGRIRPGHADVRGGQVPFPESRYELRFYVGRKVVYKSVGTNAQDALAARDRQEGLMVARDAARASGATLVEKETARKNLLTEKQRWIDRLEARGKLRAVETMGVSIDDFLAASELIFADQITEDTMLHFYKSQRKRGNAPRTIYNKAMDLGGWFKWMGLDVKAIIPDKPAFTEKEVEVYTPEELGHFFESIKKEPYQTIVFESLLKTGVRMQEGMHLEWPNVLFRSKIMRVRENWQEGSRIKDRAERSVPMPDDLVEALQRWHRERPKAHLVLGTKHDTPNWKWLQTLKRSVRRAGLNCGRCKGCVGTQECNRWYLHKFRATYTTRLLQSGVDARTVMAYTGHEDLATVMRYLAPAESAPMQAKISGIQWTR